MMHEILFFDYLKMLLWKHC